MRVFITGATGFVGSHIARHLAALGCEVAGSSTSGADAPCGTTIQHRLGGSVDDTMFAGTDAVVHAAHDLARGSRDRNVVGTIALAEAARARGVARQIFISSYSAHKGATTEYGRVKLQVQDYFLTQGWSVALPGLIIGPGGLYATMANVLKVRRIVPLVYPTARIPIVAIRDFSIAIGRMIEQTGPGLVRLYLDERVTMQRLLREIRRSVGSRALLVPVPYRIASAGAWAAEALGIRSPLGRDNIEALRANQVVTAPGELHAYVIQPMGLVEMIDAAA